MKKQLFASAVLLLTANISFSQVFINEVSTNTDEIEVFGQTCGNVPYILNISTKNTKNKCR